MNEQASLHTVAPYRKQNLIFHGLNNVYPPLDVVFSGDLSALSTPSYTIRLNVSWLELDAFGRAAIQCAEIRSTV